MNQIYIQFLTRYLRKDKVKITSIIKRTLICTLKEEAVKNIGLSIVLVGNNQIRKINRQYLKRNRITDVVAFPLADKEKKPQRPRRLCGEDNLIGEIIVSVEKALTEARIRKIHPHQEIIRYCVHGLLHLLGYDDHRRKDRKRMWNKQEQILGEIFKR
jgi:probable rRNA maturation factor